jgi:hypothetical protein
MREIKIKSVLPVYGVAAAWLVYCLFFPLYKTWHFIVLASVAVIFYAALSVIFPGRTEYIEIPEEPERTGDEEVDALLAEGEAAVTKMRSLLREGISDELLRKKVSEIAYVTDKIFKNLLEDRGGYKQIRRFADYYVPKTLKLLSTYENFEKSGARGENIKGTMERIDSALDTMLDSYKKIFDALFAHRALDIETDIRVLESMLKKEGFGEKDF